MEHGGLMGRDRLDLEVIAAASADVCILVTGKSASAVGLPRRIRSLDGGRPGDFKVVKCAWPEPLLDEQIFPALRPGSNGTLFLEEITDLSPGLQDRLLEALDGTLDPRGQSPTRARIVASTSESLIQRVREGRFNERLLDHLNVIRLVVPPEPGDC